MSYLQEIRDRQAELAGLRHLLSNAEEDPLGKPLLEGRVRALEAEVAKMAESPPKEPEAELLFAGKPVIGSRGIDAKFASSILADFQDMVSNHHGGRIHSAMSVTGRRPGENESKLFLTALPRGSFGLRLTQPRVENFVAAQQVAEALEELTSLVESAASGDATFTSTVSGFHPRVLKPLARFLESLKSNEASVAIRAGTRQSQLSVQQVAGAFERVAAAETMTETKQLRGVFRGLLLDSWRFDFTPAGQTTISGALAETVTDEEAQAMLRLINHDCVAHLSMTKIKTRSGFGRPSYELSKLESIDRQ